MLQILNEVPFARRITASRMLDIFIFNLQQIDEELTSHAQLLKYLESLGFKVSPEYFVTDDIEAAVHSDRNDRHACGEAAL